MDALFAGTVRLVAPLLPLLAPLLSIVGPTASGKSALALYLAEELDGEIVNCDSLQLYRHFDVGTAKLAPVERRAVPHHLIDILEPNEVSTAGEYARRARTVLEQIRARGHLPILVGGAGFYLHALLEGLFPSPVRDEHLRRRLRLVARTRKTGYLHRLLRRLDPESAARIHAHDTPKLIRAIEVCLQARRPMSALWREAQRETQGQGRLEGFRTLKLGLNPPRRLLYQRIDQRAERMFTGQGDAGIVAEVRALLGGGVPATVKPFESVGYREALAVVESRMAVEEAIQRTQLRTRHYAKRQITWFRRERDVHWLATFGDDPATQHAALAWVQRNSKVENEN